MGVINNYIDIKKSDAGQIAGEVAALESNQGAEYSSSVEYEVGDYCLHNGTLYLCTEATTGTFDSSDWEPTTITAELKKKGEGSTGSIKLDDSQIMNANGGNWMFLVEAEKNVLSLHTTATLCNATLNKPDGTSEVIPVTSTTNPQMENLPLGQYSISTQSSQTSATYKTTACLAQITTN